MSFDITKIIYNINNRIQSDFNELTKDSDCSYIEAQILKVLQLEGRCNQEYLASKTGIKKSFISQIIKKMASKDFIEINKSMDKRNNYIGITNEGIKQVEQFDEILDKYNKQIMENLSDLTQSNIEINLNIILANIYKMK